MALTALWTHGNAVVPESPQQLEKFIQLGFGTDVTSKQGVPKMWFHVPMPTPPLLNGQRPKLKRVALLGKSGDVSSAIRRVHIFDGSDRVQDKGVLISGNNLNFNEGCVVQTGSQPIFKGLGISMFLDASSVPFSYFFAAFGADWE
ncbi:hypothetical protein [Streptomyces hirsutus]|uniref:hypothetical protein n=1 Tax=Streptomyces hirsutus TaxID=35620 RepID=UPI0033262B73